MTLPFQVEFLRFSPGACISTWKINPRWMMTQGKFAFLIMKLSELMFLWGVISSYCDCTILGQGRCLVIVTIMITWSGCWIRPHRHLAQWSWLANAFSNGWNISFGFTCGIMKPTFAPEYTVKLIFWPYSWKKWKWTSNTLHKLIVKLGSWDSSWKPGPRQVLSFPLNLWLHQLSLKEREITQSTSLLKQMLFLC